MNIDLEATWPGGEATKVEVRISDPERIASGDFACQVAIHPDFHKIMPIVGVDEAQARTLSRQLCETLLNSYETQGAKLRFDDGRPYAGSLTH